MEQYKYSKNIQLGFLFSLIGITCLFTFIVFRPFFLSLILAMIFAVTLLPIYRYLNKFVFKNQRFNTVITFLLFLFIVLVPTFLLSLILFEELKSIYINSLSNTGIFSQIDIWQKNISQSVLFENLQFALNFNLTDMLKQFLESIFQATGKLFSGLMIGVVHVIIFLFALFYILANVDKLKKNLLDIVPIKREYALNILMQIQESIYGVMQELFFLFVMRLVGLILLFVLFNLPNPFFWALIGAIISIIPGIGMIIAIIPAFFYFIFNGLILPGILLIVFGFALVIVIENMIAPKLIEKRIGAHPFLILLATIGGIFAFGPVGFFLGPIFLSLLVVLFKEFPKIYSSITENS
jgi:predicted PurR-regulated permease PerM